MSHKLLQIFRAGTHTSAEGQRITFSEGDLDAIAKAYDPTVHEAPLVIGHPKHDDPAYGWVQTLTRKGVHLEARASVHASFGEKAQTHKKISASFYAPDAPANPTPGVYYLRHVGFLGAVPPSVKGLRQASFSDGEEKGVVTLSFAEEPAATESETPAGEGEKAKDEEPKSKFTSGAKVSARGKTGTVTEFRAGGFYAVLFDGDTEPTRWLAEEELELAGGAAAPETASHAEARRKAADLTKREAKVREAERAVRKREHLAFCEKLSREGRMFPAPRATVVSFLEALDAASPEATTASFGEAETRPLTEIFCADFLARLPRQVEFGELAAPEDLPADADAQTIAAAAVSFQEAQSKAGITVSTAEAVAHVRRKSR